MAKASKRTKKFEKNHLKDTLERRKGFAKTKQRIQTQDKKKARKAKDRAIAVENGAAAPTKAIDSKGNGLENMTVDEFFQGGFEIMDQKSKSNGNKRKRQEEEEVDGEDEQGEVPDLSSESEDTSGGGNNEAMHESEDEGESKEVNTHASDLKDLKEKDPDFYKYLQENDPEVLGFGADAAPKGMKAKKTQKKKANVQDPESDEEEAFIIPSDSGEEGKEDNSDMKCDRTEVTIEIVKKWETAMREEKSLRSMREMILAFRAAVHAGDEKDKGFKYSVSSPNVYHELLLSTLINVPEVLHYHLPPQVTKTKKKNRIATETKKFRTLSPLLNAHAASIELLLTTLSDEKSLNGTLVHLKTLLPYILPFPKVMKKMIGTIVDVWSQSSTKPTTKINAFIVLEELAIIADPSLRESLLKTVYQGMVRGSRSTSSHTLEGINIMKNTSARLWGIDPVVGYKTGFLLIRQLASHLRSSISTPTKDSYKAVYNWQYVHSLDFWSRVLSLSCNTLLEAQTGSPSPLRPLIYPLTQITLGAARLIPAPSYFPLRFHLIRSLDRLGASSETFMPLAPLVLEVFSSPLLNKPGKPSTLRPIPLTTTLRAPAVQLKTRVYATTIGSEAADLLAEVLHPWAKNIAFPELALPVSVALSRWLKAVGKKESGNSNGELNARVKVVTDKIAANASWVEVQRARVRFAPDAKDEVAAFLRDEDVEKSPLGAFVKGVRARREEREKELEQARREDARGRSGSEDEDEGRGLLDESDASD
ncbi:MAG: Nucleolar Complex 2 protein [Vezdaea aestivalis]|nr:MAG: Nucleolar Complex 2 protein [Vezdaea aestivalis]